MAVPTNIKNGTVENSKMIGKERTWSVTDTDFKKSRKHIRQPKLEETKTGIQTNDEHKMNHLDALVSTVLCNNELLSVNIAVGDADISFGTWEYDLLNDSKKSIDKCFQAEVS